MPSPAKPFVSNSIEAALLVEKNIVVYPGVDWEGASNVLWPPEYDALYGHAFSEHAGKAFVVRRADDGECVEVTCSADIRQQAGADGICGLYVMTKDVWSAMRAKLPKIMAHDTEEPPPKTAAAA